MTDFMVIEKYNYLKIITKNSRSVSHKNRKLKDTMKGLNSKRLTFKSKSFPQRHRPCSVSAFADHSATNSQVKAGRY